MLPQHLGLICQIWNSSKNTKISKSKDTHSKTIPTAAHELVFGTQGIEPSYVFRGAVKGALSEESRTKCHVQRREEKKILLKTKEGKKKKKRLFDESVKSLMRREKRLKVPNFRPHILFIPPPNTNTHHSARWHHMDVFLSLSPPLLPSACGTTKGHPAKGTALP